MEIERKFLVDIEKLELEKYEVKQIEQAYLCTEPVVRIRKENDEYYLTYKSKGLMVREEANHPLTEESYLHLKEKTDGHVITKKRYLIPYSYQEDFSSRMLQSCKIELDVFEGDLEGLNIAEVEFKTVGEANTFVGPNWFLKDVTKDARYQNANLMKDGMPK